MNIVILNINNIFNIIFKYKYNFFIKLYLNNYIKIYKLLTYIIKYFYIHNKNVNKHTKNRSLINFSKKKIRVQKGLGKARLKNLSSPICKQGSCSFGPFYIKNVIIYNNYLYKLVYIYLFINKRSNIIIIRLEYLLKSLFIMNLKENNNIYYILNKILYFKGIYNKKYTILNLNNINNKYFNIKNNKHIILNIILYDYIILII